MTRTFIPREILLAIAGLAILPALAHGHSLDSTGGFLAGIRHPVLGFDHFLAMLSVGILSAQIGGRAILTVPSAFVGMMTIGGALGMAKVELPLIECGIALSVMALGVAICSGKKFPLALAMGAVAFFAVFHGHAHGTEMPLVASPILYAAGFVFGTAAIHIGGVLIGTLAASSPQRMQLLRYMGAAIAGIGIEILRQL
jgi:urease accessory protein